MGRLQIMRSSDLLEDDGYPTSRCVDGMNVRDCADVEGAFVHFGQVRKMHDEFTNSKTGARIDHEDRPSHHDRTSVFHRSSSSGY